MLNNDQETIAFLQRYLGYCMTGHVHEHVLVFLYGTGANGKSTFVDTVAGIFDDYAITAPMEMFLTTKYERHPTEIARLKGVRLVVAQETTKGRAWDIAKIKNLTGGDLLTGRFMRGDFFDFKPTHKLLISGNTKPSLRHIDEAIRRRFILIPFVVTIPEKERDPKLKEKLKEEWPAILRWMVDGCLEWKKVGLQIPESIRLATDDYLADQDTFAQWTFDCTERDANAFTPTRELFESWKAWCEARNLTCGSETAFADSLKEAGYDQKRTPRARGFKGLRLKAPPEPDQQEIPLDERMTGYGRSSIFERIGSENDESCQFAQQGKSSARARTRYVRKRRTRHIPSYASCFGLPGRSGFSTGAWTRSA